MIIYRLYVFFFSGWWFQIALIFKYQNGMIDVEDDEDE
jgi:hypothetical protein